MGRSIPRSQAAGSSAGRRRSTTPSSRSRASNAAFPAPTFTENDDQALDSFAKPFAEKFLVSPIAMRIRLEKLGLLHRTVPLQRLLSDGS